MKLATKAALVLAIGASTLASPKPAMADDPCYVISFGICTEDHDDLDRQQACNTYCGTFEYTCLGDNQLLCGGGSK